MHITYNVSCTQHIRIVPLPTSLYNTLLNLIHCAYYKLVYGLNILCTGTRCSTFIFSCTNEALYFNRHQNKFVASQVTSNLINPNSWIPYLQVLPLSLLVCCLLQWSQV